MWMLVFILLVGTRKMNAGYGIIHIKSISSASAKYCKTSRSFRYLNGIFKKWGKTPVSWGSELSGWTQRDWTRHISAGGLQGSTPPSSHNSSASSPDGRPTWKSCPYATKRGFWVSHHFKKALLTLLIKVLPHLSQFLTAAIVHCVLADLHQLTEEDVSHFRESSAGGLHEGLQDGVDVGLNLASHKLFNTGQHRRFKKRIRQILVH